MGDNYPSYKELFKELRIKRQKIERVMRRHNIFDWPLEYEFDTWMKEEPRLTKSGREELAELAKEVSNIKAHISLRLERKS